MSTWAEAGLNEEKMMRLVNMHWKPVYVNCGPCKQRSRPPLTQMCNKVFQDE